eukprot:m51a1_g4137 hypothetical protein (477) ;mRNA; f:205877-207939
MSLLGCSADAAVAEALRAATDSPTSPRYRKQQHHREHSSASPTGTLAHDGSLKPLPALDSTAELRRGSLSREPRLVECELLVAQDRLQETQRERDELAKRVAELTSERERLSCEVTRLTAALGAAEASAARAQAQLAASPPPAPAPAVPVPTVGRPGRSASDADECVERAEKKERSKRRSFFGGKEKKDKDKDKDKERDKDKEKEKEKERERDKDKPSLISVINSPTPSVGSVSAGGSQTLNPRLAAAAAASMPPPVVVVSSALAPSASTGSLETAAKNPAGSASIDGHKTLPPLLLGDRSSRPGIPPEWAASPPAASAGSLSPSPAPALEMPPSQLERETDATLAALAGFLADFARRWEQVGAAAQPDAALPAVSPYVEQLSRLWKSLSDVPLPADARYSPPPSPRSPASVASASGVVDVEAKIERLRNKVHLCMWECQVKSAEMRAVWDAHRTSARVIAACHAASAALQQQKVL